MKPSIYILTLLIVLATACSTKKDKFLNRNFQALNTKYNVLYNGNLALDAGNKKLAETYRDNFWEILPIERFTQDDVVLVMEDEDTKDPDFSLAEDKAIKAIQKRSMLIGGAERNPQMDEAHILLGKSRYYQQRFIPALEAFNYVLYKHENSNQIDLAKLWREKTNIRLDNELLAIENIEKLFKEKNKLKKDIISEGNAILAQAYINLNELDSAIVKMNLALKNTESNEKKSRYLFILGQLYTQNNQKTAADTCYDRIINMNRRSPRRYFMNAHVQKTLLSNPKEIDTTVWLAKANKLIKDYENNPYYDLLYFQKAWFYEQLEQQDKAISFYKKSLNHKKEDKVLTARCYKTLGDIYFENSKYVTSGQYYDSTLVYLDEKSREYRSISKKLDNLADVIKYEGISTYNDSIIKLWQLPEDKRIAFIENYISDLKTQDRLAIKEQRKAQKRQESDLYRSEVFASDYEQAPGMQMPGGPPGMPGMDNSRLQTQSRDRGAAQNNSAAAGAQPRPTGKGVNTFYFYNSVLVENGKTEFKRKWGKREKGTFWRYGKSNKLDKIEDGEERDERDERETIAKIEDIDESDDRYQLSYYLEQLPTSQTEIDSLAKDRNFAWYQLGLIYKEKFKENKKGKDKFVALLSHDPEERLILPAMYHLYKILEQEGNPDMNIWKNKIINDYPNSRYAYVLTNKDSDDDLNNNPRIVYQQIYKQYESGNLFEAVNQIDKAILKFIGDETIPKFELLKAKILARVDGLDAYENALNQIILNYPSSYESKEALSLLTEQLPVLRSLDFDKQEPTYWKIVFEKPTNQESYDKLIVALDLLIKNRPDLRVFHSTDIYDASKQMVVLHNLKTEIQAQEVLMLLRDAKEYKVSQKGFVVSSENYKVIQAKKYWTQFVNKLNQ